MGIHFETPVKLNAYSITTRKSGSSVPRPTKILIPAIEDNLSGTGFNVSTQFDPDAIHYEWLKGRSDDL